MDKPRVKGSLLTLSGSIPLAGLPEQERDDLLPRAQALKEQLVASQTLHAFMAALGARLPASELRAILQTQCGVADPPPLGFLLRLQTAFNNQVTVFNDPAGVEDTMQICGRGIILTDSKKFPGPVPHFPADGKVVTIHWVSTPNFLPKELATIKVGMKVWEHAMEGRLVFKEVNYKAVEETAPLDKVLADCSADAAYKKNLLEKLDKFIAEENAFSAVRKELKEEQNQKFLDAKEKRNTAMKALNKILMEEFRKGTLQSNPRNLLVLSSVEYLREPPMTKKGSTCTVTAQSTPGVEPFIVMLEQRFIFALAHMELLPKLITRDKFLRTVVHELGHILGLCHNFNHPRSVHVFTDFALVEMTRFLCYKSIDTGSVMAYDYVRLTESAKKVLGNKLELVGTQASPSMQDIQDVMEIYFPGETCDPPRNVLSLKDIELPQDYNPRAEQRKLRAGNELVLNISDLTKLIDSQEKFTKIAKGAMSFLEQVNKKIDTIQKKKTDDPRLEDLQKLKKALQDELHELHDLKFKFPPPPKEKSKGKSKTSSSESSSSATSDNGKHHSPTLTDGQASTTTSPSTTSTSSTSTASNNGGDRAKGFDRAKYNLSTGLPYGVKSDIKIKGIFKHSVDVPVSQKTAPAEN